MLENGSSNQLDYMRTLILKQIYERHKTISITDFETGVTKIVTFKGKFAEPTAIDNSYQ